MTERKVCSECGVNFCCFLEDSGSGEILERFDVCRGCFLGFGPKGKNPIRPITEQITLREFAEQNVTETKNIMEASEKEIMKAYEPRG